MTYPNNTLKQYSTKVKDTAYAIASDFTSNGEFWCLRDFMYDQKDRIQFWACDIWDNVDPMLQLEIAPTVDLGRETVVQQLEKAVIQQCLNQDCDLLLAMVYR